MHSPNDNIFEIRDPVHISIPFDIHERQVLDHPFVQRLRRIRQLGFAQYSFPGATHSRFSHSVGVMHLAGKAFDVIFRDRPFSTMKKYRQFRYCVRMAALLHDVGHGPYSHAVEFAMPQLNTLPGFEQADPTKQAMHEEYTIAILTQTSLAQVIESQFDFTAEHVAALVDSSRVIEDDFFMDKGCNLRPLFSQLISSNLDMDRSDYLVRDSLCTGVKYGQVDISWLHNHLSRAIGFEHEVCLALHRRALYAFDHFLISRYHMFLMVYFHKKSTALEVMLKEFVQHPDCEYQIPSDLDAYLYIDDADLDVHLRKSNIHIARRVVEQDIYKVAFESHGTPEEVDLYSREQILKEAGIPVYSSTMHGSSFSKLKATQEPIYVLKSAVEGKAVEPLYSMSAALGKSQFVASISRLFVPSEHFEHARTIMNKLSVQPVQQSLL